MESRAQRERARLDMEALDAEEGEAGKAGGVSREGRSWLRGRGRESTTFSRVLMVTELLLT